MAKPRKPKTGKKDYNVGYGKPPAQHRFKRGQSGNPKGRPKDLPQLTDLMAKELRRKGLVSIDGKQVSISMLELVAKKLVGRAAAANPRALAFLIEAMRQVHIKQNKAAFLARGTTITRDMAAKEALAEYERWIRESREIEEGEEIY